MKNYLYLVLLLVLSLMSCSKRVDTKEIKKELAQENIGPNGMEYKKLDPEMINPAFSYLSNDLETFFKSIGEDDEYLMSYGFDPSDEKQEYMFLSKRGDTISVSHWMGYYPENRLDQKVVTTRLYPYFGKRYTLEVRTIDKSFNDNAKEEISSQAINNPDAMKLAYEFFDDKLNLARSYQSKEAERIKELIKIK